MRYYVEIWDYGKAFGFLIYPIKQFLDKKEMQSTKFSILKTEPPIRYPRKAPSQIPNLPLNKIVVSNNEIFDSLSKAMHYVINEIFEVKV